MQDFMLGGGREMFIEEEYLLIKDSGEIPEIAFNASLHFLCKDAEGPLMVLTSEEVQGLEDAVIARYRKIIRRDLSFVHRHRPFYRGLARAWCNWQRLEAFLIRRQRKLVEELAEIRPQAQGLLMAFVHDALAADPQERGHLDCSKEDMTSFALALDLKPGDLPVGWESICDTL